MRILTGLTACLCVLISAYIPTVHAQRAQFLHDSLKQFVFADEPVIVIRNVRVITGDGSSTRENQSILIRKGRILQIGANPLVPDDARIVDGSDLTALPGLVMMHEHLFYASSKGQIGNYGDLQPVAFPRLYLAHGVTTMRTAGSLEPINELQIKRGIIEGRFIGPEMDITAPYLEGPGSFLYQAEPIESPDEAQRIVEFWVQQGATSFKAYNFISRENLGAAIEQAHAHDFKVTGHLCSVTFAEAIDLGIDNIEHGINSATDFMVGKKADVCKLYNAAAYTAGLDVNSARIRALIKKLVDANVAITSTLAVFADYGTRRTRPTDDALSVLSEEARQRYLQTKKGMPAAMAAMADDALKVEMAFQRAFVQAGGLLLAGTDPTGLGGTIAGFGTLWQMELLVEAGFTPLEAIRIATRNGAEYLEKLADIGTLAPGKQADIMLVRGRPDDDINYLRNVEVVFKNGIGYKSRELIDSVKGMVGK